MPLLGKKMASTALRISIGGQCGSSNKGPVLAGNSRSTLANSFRPLQPRPRPSVLCFSSRRRERAIPSVSSKIIKKKLSAEENVGEDESAADSLFRKLREVLKNVDDDISGEELEKLEQELGEALTDEELFGALESLAHGETKDEENEKEEVDDVEDDGGVDDISEVEEEIAKLVQELADVLEDDKFVEAMEYVARGETEDEEEEEEDEVVVEEEEEEKGDYDYDVKVVEVEMDDDDNEEEEEDDGDDEDDGGEDDINKLTELVEKLSTALEDDDILMKLQ